MDCDLNQWKNQQYQSDGQQAPAKIPRLLLEQPHHHQQQPSSASASALPLFVPEPNNRISSLSAFSDSTPTRFSSGMGCVFSLAQWQELELQALIFKYMLAGEPIPPELLLPIKRSFLNTPAAASACYHYPYQQYQQYQHYQPAMLQSGYWGRNAVDQEPGRCRRTDGKKWRCSREIVPGHKYCERHVHRGRNRSRKLVEGPTPAAIKGDPKAPNQTSDLPITALPGGPRFNVSVPPPPTNFIQFNQSRKAPENIGGNVGLLNIPNGDLPGEGESDGQLLRHFFDDWPRSNQELNGLGSNGGSDASLSISSSGNSSEFALKLSTGNGDEPEYQDENARGVQSQLDWGAGWNGQQGGPLAEALRSSTSNASPTSVLYELRRGTASETSSVST